MVLVVCSAVGVGGLVGYADYTGMLDTTARWQPARVEPTGPPPQNAPAPEWLRWARRSMEQLLDDQATALLAGDEKGYLAIVDPDNADLVATHKRRFRTLRALGLGVWTQKVSGGLRDAGSRTWTVTIRISYCFGDPSCRAAHVPVESTWKLKNDSLVLAELKNSTEEVNGPRPWEVDELQAAQGKRAVVAASKNNAWRLREGVRFADRAAAIADRFARWDTAPNRYVVFLAGPSEWNRWYGHDQPDWAAAWAVPVSNTATEVVIRTQHVRQAELEQLLVHELTHVTTLAGKRDGVDASTWWLLEGIAEYAAMGDRPVSAYDALVPTRTFVRTKWNGDPAVSPPGSGASLDEAGGRYGVAFLAIRRIAQRYGEDAMLDFFGRVVHDDETLDQAATAALGASWTAVKADCARFIRSAVAG